jgi:hypothetical protein
MKDISMTTARARIERVEIPVTGGSPTTGFRAYCADTGVSAEGATLEACITALEAALTAEFTGTFVVTYAKMDMILSNQ